MNSDRFVPATLEAISKQYNLLFGHSPSLRKESQLFIETFNTDDEKDDAQTYLKKAQESAKSSSELCDEASTYGTNLDSLLGTVNQNISTITSKIKRVTLPEENDIDENHIKEMEQRVAAHQQKHAEYLEFVTQKKLQLASNFNFNYHIVSNTPT